MRITDFAVGHHDISTRRLWTTNVHEGFISSFRVSPARRPASLDPASRTCTGHAGVPSQAVPGFDCSLRRPLPPLLRASGDVDALRGLLLGVGSRNSYRIIALGNMAYCHGQLGDGGRAIELYEQVLREVPDHVLAEASLNMLRAAVPEPGEG